MRLFLDSEEVLEITDLDKKILESDVNTALLNDFIKHLTTYFVTNKINACKQTLLTDYAQDLKDTHQSLPTNDNAICELIFALPSYKDRAQKDAEMIHPAELMEAKNA